MARIFLSHSSRNNAQAVALANWLAANGWGRDDIFLDIAGGIAPGERWQRALNDAAGRCEAVVFLISRGWLASRWCLEELALAHKLNKRLFGVLIDAVEIKDVPARLSEEWQLIDLESGRDGVRFDVELPGGQQGFATFSAAGLDRLRAGLVKAGLDPRYFAWPPPKDPGRAPYRGLAPMEEEDAGIFYGREAATIAALDQLRGLAEAAPPRLMAVLGGSGAGKSSFMRAGLIPRLKRDDRNFLVLPVVRPEREAISGKSGLVSSLQGAGEALGLKWTRARIARMVAGPAEDVLAFFLRLLAAVSMTGAGQASRPAIVLPIDQAEELFLAEGRDEAQALLSLLAVLLRLEQTRLIVLVTIRTDSYEKLQQAPQLTDISQSPFNLPALARGAYQRVIEGPAERLAGTDRVLKIEPALTSALLADIEQGGAKDALPLLAFTLERLYADHGSDGDLTLKEYAESGRIAGAIEAAVKRAFLAADADPGVPKDRTARLAVLRRAMIPWLAGIDPETKTPRRQVARFTDIPDEARPLIEHFVEQRLLATDVSPDTGERTIEPAHEALLRQWGLIDEWLRQDIAALAALEGVRRAARDWDANKRNDNWLSHTGGRLDDAEAIKSRTDLARRLDATDLAYLDAARAAETVRWDRELDEARKLAAARKLAVRRTRIGAVAAVLLAIVAGVFGWIGLKQADIAATQARLAQEQASEAQRQKGLAEQAAADAQRERANAEAAAKEAEAQRAEAERQKAVAEAAAADAARQRTAAEAQAAEAARQKTLAEEQAAEAQRQKDLADQAATDAERERANAEAAAEEANRQRAEAEAARQYAQTQSKLAEAERENAEVERAKAEGAAARADEQRLSAEANARQAITNETISLAALARVAQSEVRIAGAVQLALAAWPRVSDESRPQLQRAIDVLSVLLWEFRQRLILIGHKDAVSSVAFSADGSRIVTSSNDGTARVWDAATGSQLLVLEGHTTQVRSAAFSPDGTRVVTASLDNTARIWDASTGAELMQLSSQGFLVSSASFSPDGTRIVTTSSDALVHIWDAATGRELLVLRGHTGWLESARYSPDGEQLVTASIDGTARVWDAETGAELLSLKHVLEVHTAAFSPDGSLIVTASEESAARVWNASTGDEVMQLKGHEGAIRSASFSTDGKLIVTASEDRSSRIWYSGTGAEALRLRGHEDGVLYAAFSSDGERVVTGSLDQTARVWDVGMGSEILQINAGEHYILSAAFSPDELRIATSSGDGTARVWDAKTGAELVRLNGHTSYVASAAFSPDGTRIVTASWDHSARIWDAATGAELHVLRGHQFEVLSAAFSPDGRHVVTSSMDTTARTWDAATGSPRLLLQGHQMQVYSAVFSPDGARILTSSGDNTARIWNAETGSQLLQIDEKDEVTSAAYSLDGRMVAIAGYDSVVRVRDAATGALLRSMAGDNVQPAAFSPDGTRLVTSMPDNTVRVSDIETGAELVRLQGHQYRPRTAAFSPQGNLIVTAGEDHTVRVWALADLPGGGAFQIACQRLGNDTDLSDVEARYGLSKLTPICGDHAPLPVDPSKLQ